MKCSSRATALLALAAAVCTAAGDVYMHAPPGSQNRNRERNDHSNNGNRLFDSLSNAAGGYPWRGDATSKTGDPVTYYAGSKLRVEWTADQACGGADEDGDEGVHCQVLLQYACDGAGGADGRWLRGVRDGYPQGEVVDADDSNAGYKRRAFVRQNRDGTGRIPSNGESDAFYSEGADGGVEYGLHEGIEWYRACSGTERNRGLYAGDVAVLRDDARGTRQNPSGNRHGLECPEERDYWPYWRPTPWRDAAVLTSNTTWCAQLRGESQNVAASYECVCDAACAGAAAGGLAPVDEARCAAAGGTWTRRAPHGVAAPECAELPKPAGGANGEGGLMHYDWSVPEEVAGMQCVLRLRLNVSTTDYGNDGYASGGAPADSSLDCANMQAVRTSAQALRAAEGRPTGDDLRDFPPQCVGSLGGDDGDTVPLFTRPRVQIASGADGFVALAVQSVRTGTTFQDRSHVFRVEARPASVPATARIFNLGVRGRRGNAVQAYPALQYSFTPRELAVEESDWVHIQFHGSDFNSAKNANNGEGWQYSDRHNMVQTLGARSSFPAPAGKQTLFRDDDDAKRWALLEQSSCADYGFTGRNLNDISNKRDNCGVLNSAPARFPASPEDGLVQFKAGTYHYMSTRNHNFARRSQKGKLVVGGDNGPGNDGDADSDGAGGNDADADAGGSDGDADADGAGGSGSDGSSSDSSDSSDSSGGTDGCPRTPTVEPAKEHDQLSSGDRWAIGIAGVALLGMMGALLLVCGKRRPNTMAGEVYRRASRAVAPSVSQREGLGETLLHDEVEL